MERKLTAYEERMMKLLRVGSPEELNRVMSEPPDEKVLEATRPPYELYDLEEQDRIRDEVLDEIEQYEIECAEVEMLMRKAFFITRGLTVSIQDAPRPAPLALRMYRKLSCPILLESSPPEGWAYQPIRFKRTSPTSQAAIYEEQEYDRRID